MGDAFDDLMAARAVSMVVVTGRAATAHGGGEDVGCLVGFSTQCSIEPRRFLVCLSKVNHTWRSLSSQERLTLGVHVLSGADHDLAARFGGETADEVDKFAGLAVERGPGGVPLLGGCAGRLVGTEVARLDAGDHVVVVLDPLEVDGAAGATGEGEGPLTLADVDDVEPGHPA